MGTVQETVGHSSTSPRCLVLLFSVEPLIKSIMGKKKCFMTPERKKKLRTLLRKKAADELKKICQTYFDKWYSLEGEMFFPQREVILRDLQINELTISVSDMRGKFIKPTLKKVSKYENKFAKLQEKAAKFAFANQLKQSK